MKKFAICNILHLLGHTHMRPFVLEICGMRNGHVTDCPDRIRFYLAVLVYRYRSNTASAYLNRDLQWAAVRGQ